MHQSVQGFRLLNGKARKEVPVMILSWIFEYCGLKSLSNWKALVSQGAGVFTQLTQQASDW